VEFSVVSQFEIGYSQSGPSERRQAIAREAAKARWAKPDVSPDELVVTPEEAASFEVEEVPVSKSMPVAVHRGNLNIMGQDVPCYVLDNGVRVIGRTSATEVLTGIKGGGALLAALAAKLFRGGILAVGGAFLDFLAGGDSHDLHGGADHVSGALLSFRSLRHGYSVSLPRRSGAMKSAQSQAAPRKATKAPAITSFPITIAATISSM
jgi:hypothetical protein